MIDKVFGATKWAAGHDSVSRLNGNIVTLQQVTSYCSATATPIRFFFSNTLVGKPHIPLKLHWEIVLNNFSPTPMFFDNTGEQNLALLKIFLHC